MMRAIWRRQCLVFFLGSLIVCAALAAPPLTPVTVYEAGFENYTAVDVNGHPPKTDFFPQGSSTIEEPWQATGVWNGVAAGTNGLDVALGHSGDKAAYFGQNNNTGIGYQEILNHTLNVNQSYILTFWVLPFHNPAPNGWRFDAWMEAGGQQLGRINLDLEMSQNEWREFQVIVTPQMFANAGVGNGALLSIRFQSGGSRQVGAYLDDVSLRTYPGEYVDSVIIPIHPYNGESNILTDPATYQWYQNYRGTGTITSQAFYLGDDAQIVAQADDSHFGDMERSDLGADATEYESSSPLPNDNGNPKDYYWKVTMVVQEDANEVVYDGDVWRFSVLGSTADVGGLQDDVVLTGRGSNRYYGMFTADINIPLTWNVTGVEWYKNDALLTIDASKYVASNTNTQAELIINDVQLSDIGEYYCKVNVDVGDPNTSNRAWLDVRQGLVHRYSFTGDISDSVGNADGTLINPIDPNDNVLASFSDGTLILDNPPGHSSVDDLEHISYVELPSGIISPLGRYATIEVWASNPHPAAGQFNGGQMVFSFGNANAGVSENAPDWAADLDSDSSLVSFWRYWNSDMPRLQFGSIAEEFLVQVNTPYESPIGAQVCLAYVFDGFRNEIRSYYNGEQAGVVPMPGSLADLNDVNNWLGRASGPNAPVTTGSYDELRIYDWPYDNVWVREHYLMGPDADPDTANPCLVKPEFDLNNDCQVDIADMAEFVISWLQTGYYLN